MRSGVRVRVRVTTRGDELSPPDQTLTSDHCYQPVWSGLATAPFHIRMELQRTFY